MDELEFDGKKYFSSKRAAEVTGYAKDYVGQLCREGRVEARLVGRAWYVSEDSIREHRFGEEEKTASEEVEVVVPEVLPESEEEESVPAWNTASYSTEVIDVIPTLVSRPSLADLDIRAERPSPVDHMQSVWQDWFTRDAADAPEEIQGPSEVTITRIAEEPVREEAVPIYRIPMRESVPPVAPIHEERKVEAPERQAVRSRAPRKESGNFIMQALLVAFILVIASVTYISLGYGADVALISQNPIIEYISGVSK